MSASASGSPSVLPANVTVISIHPMYSAWQVVLAAFLGGALGAGWLIALNYKRLGEPTKARMAIVLGALVMVALLVLGVVSSDIAHPLLLLPTVASGPLMRCLQGDRYDRHVAVGGSRGSRWRAAGIGVVSLAISVAATRGAVAVQIATKLPDKITIGNATVYYTEDVSRFEAQRVGEVIVALGRKGATWQVEVTRERDRPVIAVVAAEWLALDSKVRRQYHHLAGPLSRTTYDGMPVDIWLVDPGFEPHTKLTWESRDW